MFFAVFHGFHVFFHGFHGFTHAIHDFLAFLHDFVRQTGFLASFTVFAGEMIGFVAISQPNIDFQQQEPSKASKRHSWLVVALTAYTACLCLDVGLAFFWTSCAVASHGCV